MKKRTLKDIKNLSLTLPKVNYMSDPATTIEVNHYRRIKRALQRNGQEGVRKYLQDLSELINQNKQDAGQ